MTQPTAPATADKEASALAAALDGFRRREGDASRISGKRLPDRNDPARFIVVSSSGLYYSIDASDLVEVQSNAEDVGLFWIRAGAEVWRAQLSTVPGASGTIAESLELEAAPLRLGYGELTQRVIAGIRANSGEVVEANDKLTALAIPDPFALTKLGNIVLSEIASEIGAQVTNWLSVRDMGKIWPKGLVKDLVAKIAGPLGVAVPKE